MFERIAEALARDIIRLLVWIVLVVSGVIGLIAFFAGRGSANPPVYRYRYVEQVAVPYYLPLPVSVPAYSVGAAAQMDPALLERIAVALEKIAARGEGAAVGELPPEPEHVGLVRQNCASCHGITPKGNKLSFFEANGRFKEPTPEVLGSMIAAVSSGSMPKGGKMEAADRLKLIAGLTTQPEAAATPKGK